MNQWVGCTKRLTLRDRTLPLPLSHKLPNLLQRRQLLQLRLPTAPSSCWPPLIPKLINRTAHNILHVPSSLPVTSFSALFPLPSRRFYASRLGSVVFQWDMYSVVARASELTANTASLDERGAVEVLKDFEALMRTVEGVGVDAGFVFEVTTPWAKRVAGGGSIRGRKGVSGFGGMTQQRMSADHRYDSLRGFISRYQRIDRRKRTYRANFSRMTPFLIPTLIFCLIST